MDIYVPTMIFNTFANTTLSAIHNRKRFVGLQSTNGTICLVTR